MSGEKPSPIRLAVIMLLGIIISCIAWGTITNGWPQKQSEAVTIIIMIAATSLAAVLTLMSRFKKQ